MPKKVLIAFPPAMVEEMDRIAKCEHRTRSDLVREAMRRYMDSFKRTNIKPAPQSANLDCSPTPAPAPVADVRQLFPTQESS